MKQLDLVIGTLKEQGYEIARHELGFFICVKKNSPIKRIFLENGKVVIQSYAV